MGWISILALFFLVASHLAPPITQQLHFIVLRNPFKLILINLR